MVGESKKIRLAVFVVLGVALIYTGWTLSGEAFWGNIASGVLTAVMALAVGIPIGLSIDRALQTTEAAGEAAGNKGAQDEQQQRTQEAIEPEIEPEIELKERRRQRELAEDHREQQKAERQHAQELAERQQQELLELLRNELTACRSMLEDRIKHPENLHVQPLKSSFWHAVAATEKINCIQSTRLLDSLSSVYHQIDTIRRIEELGYQSVYHAAASHPGGGVATQQLWRDARSFDESLSRDLERVCYLIEQALQKA